ncbi:unnamed protein product, partial [Strongylus vulgaris]
IQTVSRIIEVGREYRLPLVLTFVDYEKAYDSAETNAIVSAPTTKLFHRPLNIPEGVSTRRHRVAKAVYCRVAVGDEWYLGRSMNMENDLKEELNRRRRAAWAPSGP